MKKARSENVVLVSELYCVPRKTCLAFLSVIALCLSGAEGYRAVPLRHLHNALGIS